MGSNSFGSLFRVTTFGESHGPLIGVTIDGCPAGLPIDFEFLHRRMHERRGGLSSHTTPRKESDIPEIVSGVFEGVTTGAPLTLLIKNENIDSTKYDQVKDLIKPGHANYTYLEKYGIFDHRGGGRASARETACRTAAGAIAELLLQYYGIHLFSYIEQIGQVRAKVPANREELSVKPPLFCPDPQASLAMEKALTEAQNEGDSLGGIVGCTVFALPAGLGDPVYEKIEANLAKAMLSIPASKGFEIGEGFAAAAMKGSQHNDQRNAGGFMSNHAGGTLGGITTGEPLYFRVAFKPTSSIKKAQQTTTLSGAPTEFVLPKGSKHDPCVAIRAASVVRSMTALVLADAILRKRLSRL